MKILQQIPSPEFVEEKHSFTLKVLLLGIRRNQIDVHIDGRYLWISATSTYSTDFQKTFVLPDGVRAEGAQAICHNGFLTIHLEKGIFEDNPNLIKVKVKDESKFTKLLRFFFGKT